MMKWAINRKLGRDRKDYPIQIGKAGGRENHNEASWNVAFTTAMGAMGQNSEDYKTEEVNSLGQGNRKGSSQCEIGPSFLPTLGQGGKGGASLGSKIGIVMQFQGAFKGH